MAKEIEIKIKLEDAASLKQKVLSLGGKKIEEGDQLDVMYDDGNGFFEGRPGQAPPKVLRLRRNPEDNRLTYKEIIPELAHEHMLQRIEIETKVDNYEAMDEIIRKLGFVPYRIKEKYFENFELDGFKLEFHKLPFIGDYLEIEAEEEKLITILPSLNLTIQDGVNKDYTQLHYDFCESHGLGIETPQTFEEEKKFKG